MSYHLSSRARFGPGGWIEIYGTHGALVYKLFAEEIMGAGDGDEALGPLEVPADEVRTQTTDAEFIAAIRGGAPVSPELRGGAAVYGVLRGGGAVGHVRPTDSDAPRA